MKYTQRQKDIDRAFAQAWQWGLYYAKQVLTDTTVTSGGRREPKKNRTRANDNELLEAVTKLIHDSFQYGPTYFAVASELIDEAKMKLTGEAYIPAPDRSRL